VVHAALRTREDKMRSTREVSMTLLRDESGRLHIETALMAELLMDKALLDRTPSSQSADLDQQQGEIYLTRASLCAILCGGFAKPGSIGLLGVAETKRPVSPECSKPWK
jgi:hypothetical protein